MAVSLNPDNFVHEPETTDLTFFDLSEDVPSEIIQGLIRERQIGLLTGGFGVGKSPLLQEWTYHVAKGLPWCGRQVNKRPVIALDFETPGSVCRQNMNRLADRHGVGCPSVPDELELYLHLDSPQSPATARMIALMQQKPEERVVSLRSIIGQKPNALILIDPIELLLSFDKLKSAEIIELYCSLRSILIEHPQAAFVLTFNLRKKDRRGDPPSLLSDPRTWLEEVGGNLDLMNRSDVRLGIDFEPPDEPDIRVINGVRRGEDMHPILIRQVGTPPDFAGFELADPGSIDLLHALTSTQYTQWQSLPDQFRFEEVADKLVPRSSLYRLIERTRSLGVLETRNKVHRKKQP